MGQDLCRGGRPVFNFILAFILSVIIVGFVGYDPAEIVEVQQDSAASEAGLEAGDVITEYNGYHVDLAKDLYVYSYLNSLNEGDTVTLKVRRDGETKEIQYTPDVSVRYLLGFNRSDASSMTVESLIEGMPLEAAGLQPGRYDHGRSTEQRLRMEKHMMLTFRSTRFQMSRWRLLMCVTDWIIRQRSRRRNTAHRYLDFPIIWDIRRRTGLKC